MLVLKVTLVPFILSPGNGRQGDVGPLEEMVGSVICYSGLPKPLLCQKGFFV